MDHKNLLFLNGVSPSGLIPLEVSLAKLDLASPEDLGETTSNGIDSFFVIW